MTAQTSPQTNTHSTRGRKRTFAAAVASEGSDVNSEAGEVSWEWIYSTEQTDNGEGDRKRRRGSASSKIVGARYGDFECRIGDTVMLKAGDVSYGAWIAIICDFREDSETGEMSADFMWFLTEKEIRNKGRKREDFYWNELYISPSFDVNPLASINGKANIMSLDAFLSAHPSGKISRNSPDFGKTFVCRRGCNTRSTTYTDEFVWEEVYKNGENVSALKDFVEKNTRATRRKARAQSPPEPEGTYVPPQTPTKTGRNSATTPKSKRGPRSGGKKLEFTPLATRKLSPSQVQSSPFQIARSRLHVSAVPSSLPCREGEFSLVYSHLEAAITEGTGNCIYISGTPGTGKTATVREVISRLEEAVGSDELDDFIFVEINGMKITDPHQAYSLLWEAIKGERASPAQSLDLLEREFSNPSPRRVPCVVLMDELDQLVTKNQAVMYNFFNWPTLRHSRLIVLAVANTMDLPERTLSNKISSRLGLTRITFPGYNHDQLMKIIQSRLEGVPGNIVDADAVQFASRKVAAVSGDARRALDICRRAVELAEGDAPGDPMTPSKRANESGILDQSRRGRVTISTIKRAINEATTNPIQQHLRGLPLTSKMLMAALLLRIRRSGLAETTLGETLDELQRSTAYTARPPLGMAQILPGLGKGNQAGRRVAGRPHNIHTAALELVAAGLVNLEAHRADRSSKLRLAIADDEVKMALRDDADLKSMGLSV
ncbi:P-loop containing nucleoside triphosphate hydrolase protein [Trichoderma austrokoningii]